MSDKPELERGTLPRLPVQAKPQQLAKPHVKIKSHNHNAAFEATKGSFLFRQVSGSCDNACFDTGFMGCF